jgi:hypothetical protein
MIDRESTNKTQRAWCDKNRESVRAANSKWRKNNLEKVKAKDKRYRKTNKDKINRRNKEIRKNVFIEVLNHYGHVCHVCGSEQNPCIDHIGGNYGNSPKSGASLWFWLKKNNFPPGFRTLCNACNIHDGWFRKYPLFGIKSIDDLVLFKGSQGLIDKNQGKG